LYTPVEGQAKRGVSILKVVEALHPTPALGGFPRLEAVKVIRRVELLDRGWYAAPVGWVNCKMDGEFAVAIRSGLIQGNEASLFAGCGIVGDSDPIGEYNETGLKFRPMLSALQALDSEA
jgi:menaquinone-specific isochorismate synthase